MTTFLLPVMCFVVGLINIYLVISGCKEMISKKSFKLSNYIFITFYSLKMVLMFWLASVLFVLIGYCPEGYICF